MPLQTNKENRDPKQANSRLVIADFHGMAPSQNPHSQDASFSSYQLNCYAFYPGQLNVRRGLKLVQFLT
jgi:hypothetical protein